MRVVDSRRPVAAGTPRGTGYPGGVFPGLLARPIRALVILALLVAVGAGLWLWDRAGQSTPADEAAALADVRAAGGADAAARPGVPRSGVYRFRQAGSERGGVGPVHISRGLPDQALYVVTPAPGGYAEELDISEEHIEGQRLRVGEDGARQVSRRSKVTFLGVGRDDRRVLRPAPLRMPRQLPVGAAWSARYAAAQLPMTARSTVLRADVVEVGGRRLPVRVIRTVVDTGGIHHGRRIDTLWWSPALALPLRWSIDMRISGVVSLRTRADLTIESTTPAV